MPCSTSSGIPPTVLPTPHGPVQIGVPPETIKDALETGRDDWTVYVRPEQVVEIAFGDVQTSPRARERGRQGAALLRGWLIKRQVEVVVLETTSERARLTSKSPLFSVIVPVIT